MEEINKRRKILYIVLGIIVLILLFFMISSCSNKETEDNPKAITEIMLAMETITLTVDEEETLSYTISPTDTDETTKWITSDSDVVSIDTRGNIKALKTGSAVITLVSEGGVFDSVNVKVVSKLTEGGIGVTANLIEKDVNLKIGSTKKLNYELDPIDSKYIEVMWESNNPLVATVSSDGVITGLKSGVTSVSVRITLSDNTVITDTATVTVEENVSLYLTTTPPDLRVGEVIRLSAALSTSDVIMTEGFVKSSSENVATVSNVSVDGNYLIFDVKGVKAGNTTLKVSAITSDGKTLNLDVPVTVVKFTDLYISSGNKTLEIGNSFILSGRLEPIINGSLDTECKSSNEKVATVTNVDPSGEYNGACQITAISDGSATITMTISGQKNSIKVTVSDNSETPNDPNNPDNPSTPGTPVDPENPGQTDNPIGAATLSVTLDKTTYSINEQAVITVNFTDEKGNTKTLSSGEYVMATEFDSSSLGTKKLVVVYPYGETSLKAEVEYTISGGSSSGVTSGTPGSGGYSSSGGRGNSHSKSGGVISETIVLTPTDNNEKNSDGSYKGSVEVDVKTQAWEWDSSKQENVIVTFECIAEDPSKCEKATHNDLWNSDIFKAKEANLVTSTLDSKINVTGDYFAIYRNNAGTWTLDSNSIDMTNPANFDKVWKESITLGGNNAVNLIKAGVIKDPNTGEIIKIKYDNVSQGENNKAGTLTIRPEKRYKRTDASMIYHVHAIANPGYQLLNIHSNDLDIYFQGSSAAGSSKKETVTATAVFQNLITGKSEFIEASATVEIDDVLDSFTCSEVENSIMTIKCVAEDSVSGVDKIASDVEGKWSGDSSRKEYEFSFTVSGTYTFTASDNAGNTKSTSVTINENMCYKKAKCGGESCISCEAAGCYEGTEPIYNYICTPVENKKAEIFEIFRPAIKEYNDENGYSYKHVEMPEEYYYSEKVKVRVLYKCVVEDSDYLLCGVKKGEEYSPAETGFQKNCKYCGCETSGWTIVDETKNYTNINDYGQSAIATAEEITAYKIMKFKDSNCTSPDANFRPEYRFGSSFSEVNNDAKNKLDGIK